MSKYLNKYCLVKGYDVTFTNILPNNFGDFDIVFEGEFNTHHMSHKRHIERVLWIGVCQMSYYIRKGSRSGKTHWYEKRSSPRWEEINWVAPVGCPEWAIKQLINMKYIRGFNFPRPK